MTENRTSSADARRTKRNKAKLRRRKIKKLTRLIILVLVVILAVVLVASHGNKSEKAFKKFADNQFIEGMNLVTISDRTDTEYSFDESTNGFSTAVQKKIKADKLMESFVDEKIAEVQKKAKKKASADAESALLTRWKVTDAPNGATSLIIYSVLYENYDKDQTPKKEYLSTYQFKSDNLNLLKPLQVVEEEYKEAVSEEAIKRVHKEYAKKELAENWEDYFIAIGDDLNCFSADQEKITFYEKAGNDGRYVKAEVPLDKVTGVLRAEVVPRMVEAGDKMVAITYDDGPGGKSEEKILASLEKYDGRATFFYLGNLIAENPENVKKAHKLGCEIGNHSWNHPDLKSCKTKKVKSQIKKTNEAIEKVTGEKPTLFRPPYGSYGEKTLKAVNLPFVFWSVDSKDWESKNKDAILEVVENAENLDGSIILMHSIHDATADATEELLPWLSWHGYQTVTVSELAKFQTGENPKAHEIVHCE